MQLLDIPCTNIDNGRFLLFWNHLRLGLLLADQPFEFFKAADIFEQYALLLAALQIGRKHDPLQIIVHGEQQTDGVGVRVRLFP